MGKPRYKTQDFINAIPGTGGIVSSIARKVGCVWNTANVWIQKPTVKRAYDDECEAVIDTAEGVVIGNIQAAVRKQQKGIKDGDPVIVDSADAKWYLSRKGKRRGYADKQEIEQTGDVTIRVVYDDPD